MQTPNDPKQIFLRVLELTALERGAFLDAACGGDAALRERVEALLAPEERAGAFLTAPTQGADNGISDGGAPAEQPSSVIGRFKLLQQIGEGGFGTVWIAEQQQPVQRRVALKIVKRDMDTRSVVPRFE